MAYVKKTDRVYNVRGNGKVVNAEISRAAHFAIGTKAGYCPAVEAEIDRILGIGIAETDNEPDPDFLIAETETHEDDDSIAPWINEEPTDAELEKVEKEFSDAA